MLNEKAITRMQAIAIVVIIVIAAVAAGAYFVLQAPPAPPKRTLTIWRTEPFSETSIPYWNALISGFKEANPDIEVIDQVFGEDPINDKITAALTIGTGLPDIAYCTKFQPVPAWAFQGKLEPLDEIADWMLSTYGDDVNKQALLACHWRGPDGESRYYGLPNGLMPWVVMVRVDLLQGAGLTLDDIRTYSGFEKALYILKDKYGPQGIYPFDIQMGTASYDGQEDFLCLLGAINGVPPIAGDGSIQFNKTAAQRAGVVRLLASLDKWYKDGIIPRGAFAEGDYDNNDNFQKGMTVITPNTLSIWRWIKSNKPEWIEQEKFISIGWPGNLVDGKSINMIYVGPWMVFKGIPEERKQAAFSFLKYFYDYNNYKKWFQGIVGDHTDAPLYNSLLNEPPFTTDPVMKELAQTTRNIMVDPPLLRPSWSLLMADYVIGRAQLKVFTGEWTPEQAADWLIEQVYAYAADNEGVW